MQQYLIGCQDDSKPIRSSNQLDHIIIRTSSNEESTPNKSVNSDHDETFLHLPSELLVLHDTDLQGNSDMIDR